MFKKILLSICLLLLTTVSSSEAAFTPKASRPDFNNLLANPIITDSRALSAKEAKIFNKAGEITKTLAQLAANEDLTAGLAADLANRTATNQIFADVMKNLAKAESIFNQISKTASLDEIYSYNEEPLKFTDRAKLMKEQLKNIKDYANEFRLFAGSDLSRQNNETLNGLYLRREDNAPGYETWKICWEKYYSVFDDLRLFFAPEPESV